MARIITITSGKGGVGKTSLSLNLSLELASRGARVCLFDADLGLANINILTGLHPEHDLGDVIDGRLTLGDILIRNYRGLDIIPGSSGVERMAALTRQQSAGLARSFLSLDAYDYFIFDTSAGISPAVMAFCRASHEVLLVITPEPTSLTDGYALLKVLSRNRTERRRIHVVINQADRKSTAQKAYATFHHTVSRFLPIDLSPLGILCRDGHVAKAVAAQTPFVLMFPDAAASRCIRAMAERLAGISQDSPSMPLELFWDRCLAHLSRTDGHLSPGIPSDEPAPLKDRTPPPSPAWENLPERLAAMEAKLLEILNEIRYLRGEVEHTRPAAAEDTKEAPSSQSLIKPADSNGEEPVPLSLESGEYILDFEAWLEGENRKTS